MAGTGSQATMENTHQAAARASAIARSLSGARGASMDELSALLCQLLDAAGLSAEQRLDILGGAFVAEAVGPQWKPGTTADDAHESLRLDDSELADAVEAVATVLLGRAETRHVTGQALAELRRLLSEA
ncbi:MAG: hypothetical protein IT301_02655 [Dehalococcoidia bacterium]|nr:hypothetical protein [Dehalococcoidia bacterium]